MLGGNSVVFKYREVPDDSRRAAFVWFIALLAGRYRTVCAVPLLDVLWHCWPDGTGRFVPCHFCVLHGVA